MLGRKLLSCFAFFKPSARTREPEGGLRVHALKGCRCFEIGHSQHDPSWTVLVIRFHGFGYLGKFVHRPVIVLQRSPYCFKLFMH